MVSHLQDQLNNKASLDQIHEVENTLKFNFAQVRRDLKQQIKRLNGFIHEQKEKEKQMEEAEKNLKP